MDLSNGPTDFTSRVELYRSFDVARQIELEDMAKKYDEMKVKLDTLEQDNVEEKQLRQTWRKRAQEAESVYQRNSFVLVLVDGDGYIFKDAYLRDAHSAGGARAAHDLSTEVLDYLEERSLIDSSGPELQVMVNVYANRAGLTQHLYDADMIQLSSQFDQFFQSFTNSKSLFQFIDCGYGKERADTKLRDTFRFFASDVHCKYIFLACCHDNGYVAELEKYRHNVIAAPKTILVDSHQMGRDYRSLNFPIVRLSVFDTQPLPVLRKDFTKSAVPAMSRISSMPVSEDRTPPTTSDAAATTAASTWSSITASTAPTTAQTPIVKKVATTVVAPINKESLQPEWNEPSIARTKGIPVNRQGQRVDLKMALPSSQDLDAFEERIATRKLCNKHHLGGDCYTYNCRYDHDPIGPRMMNTLRYKARSIPCQNGPSCRDADCFYGHQCPWGRDKCANIKCAFLPKGMHNITDVEVAKYVPAEGF